MLTDPNPESSGVPARDISAVVELDAYSGQQNPRWELEGKICQDVLEEIAHLATERSQTQRPDQLGYRGLRVIMDAGAGRYAEFYVAKGHVFLHPGGMESVLIDRKRQIEQKLLESGRQTSDNKLSALISQILQTLSERRS